jgi:transcriptional regulator with XRE-family HTH domain
MTNAELKAIRKALNLTQTKMGLLLGMEQPHYSRLETGYEGRQPTKQHAAFVRTIKLVADHGLLDKLFEISKG